MRYILASASPRRHELLKRILPDFEIMPADVDENISEDLPPEVYCVTLAESKASVILSAAKNIPTRRISVAVGEERPRDNAIFTQVNLPSSEAVTIAADTIVYKDGKYYGKPKDKKEAAEHLRTLRNASHKVYTGVAVASNGKIVSGYQKTAVIFGDFPDNAIDRYIAEQKPYDKAGAYGVQDIEEYCRVEYFGDYENVMGLPLGLTEELINKITK